MIALALLLLPVALDDPLEFFEKEVRPVLVERCQSCHGPEKRKGGLRLDSRAALLTGGDSGPAAEPGDPAASLLVEVIGYEGDIKMPPRTKLTDREAAVLKRWVERGLPWPETAAKADTIAVAETFDLKARRDSHWAWRPVVVPELPDVRDHAWSRSPIDRFVLARLEQAGLRPAPEADRPVLLRRLTFDLIGLPPTTREIADFLADDRPDAYERQVDRLLASPHFGERWGRHWLDLVRYAETRGHEFDAVIPNAYQYRDYVIRALNNDVPYDRFVREHIAGDLLETARRDPARGFDESVLGTGFWFLGEEVHSPVDVRQDETDRIDNRLDVFGKTFLGLTIACARCHDHKFDAISQRDYYALAGFLIGGSYRQVRFETRDQEREVAQRLEAIRREVADRVPPLAAQARHAVLGDVDRLLAATAELLQAAAPAMPDPERGRLVDHVARQRGLDPAHVDRWLREVASARENPRHPLHAFARLAAEPDADEPDAFAAHRLALLDEVKKRLSGADAPSRLVVDFGEGPQMWRPDGHAYGPRALRPGETRLVGPADKPALDVIDRAAAYRMLAWEGPTTVEGNQRDHGRLGEWSRAGQLIRTPEFTLDGGTLWYLAKGPLRAYAVVHSHLLIAGPLHGALLGDWKGDDTWRWVKHDLTAYKGQRLHVEFSPGGPGTFAIARVVEGAAAPALVEGADLLARALLEGPSLARPADLVPGLARALREAMARYDGGPLDGPDVPAWTPALARWVVARPELFEAPNPTLRDALAELGRRQAETVAAWPLASRTAPAMLDGNGVDEHLLIRGNSRTPSHQIPRRNLEAIGGDRNGSPPAETSGRHELAEMVAAADNPLTARVFVNRVWHHLLGRGIVASVDNLGVLGERPSHPELLDFLAERFVQDGWSLKGLVRQVVVSSTYRMSSRGYKEGDRLDPDDLLPHRARVRRLQGEPLRDAVLAVSGRLDRAQFGPSVPVHLTPFLQGRGRPDRDGPIDGAGRRSIYLEVRRNFLSPFLLAFDMPIPFSTMGRRNVSNVPAQALVLLNDPFIVGEARRWAARALAEHPADGPRLAAMYQDAFGRPPSPQERDDARDFLRAQTTARGGDAASAWADLAHVLFNSKEFLFIQ